MRWRGRRGSGNIEDRRGISPGIVGGGLGAVVLTLIALALGVDPGTVLQQQADAPASPRHAAAEDSLAQFVSVVLADTEEVWGRIFREEVGQTYAEPRLVLFTGFVQSACGSARAATGPFYCPLDRRIYIDLGFFQDMREHLGAPGDFARAYVIAHEVGHHVQTLLGISEEVHRRRQASGRAESNALSVRQELQADCFAGVWANRAQQMWQILEPGDVEEALGAASAVGDDRLQQRSQGHVVPESFTHGTAAQRARWFQQGMQSGQPSACDTFASGP